MRYTYSKDDQRLLVTFDASADTAQVITDIMDWLRPGSAEAVVAYMRESPDNLYTRRFDDVPPDRAMLFKLTFGGAA